MHTRERVIFAMLVIAWLTSTSVLTSASALGQPRVQAVVTVSTAALLIHALWAVTVRNTSQLAMNFTSRRQFTARRTTPHRHRSAKAYFPLHKPTTGNRIRAGDRAPRAGQGSSTTPATSGR